MKTEGEAIEEILLCLDLHGALEKAYQDYPEMGCSFSEGTRCPEAWNPAWVQHGPWCQGSRSGNPA